jgi:hypothetical protein
LAAQYPNPVSLSARGVPESWSTKSLHGQSELFKPDKQAVQIRRVHGDLGSPIKMKCHFHIVNFIPHQISSALNHPVAGRNI